MFTARIRFLGSVHDVVQSPRDFVELPDDATVQDLIAALIDRHGDGLARRILNPDGKVQIYTRIFVDGYEVDYARPRSTLPRKGGTDADIEVFVIQMTMGG